MDPLLRQRLEEEAQDARDLDRVSRRLTFCISIILIFFSLFQNTGNNRHFAYLTSPYLDIHYHIPYDQPTHPAKLPWTNDDKALDSLPLHLYPLTPDPVLPELSNQHPDPTFTILSNSNATYTFLKNYEDILAKVKIEVGVGTDDLYIYGLRAEVSKRIDGIKKKARVSKGLSEEKEPVATRFVRGRMRRRLVT